MRQLLDILPVVIFVSVFFSSDDIYLATALLMIALAVQLVLEKIIFKAVKSQTKVVFVIALIFGGMTIVFQNDLFIKWKPTIVNWCFAAILIISNLVFKKNLIKKMVGKQLLLDDFIWRNINYGWALGFFVAGIINLAVAYSFSTDIWVTFKLIGGPLITVSYAIITIAYLIKGGHLKQVENNVSEERVDKNQTY
jgi:intracellular septation protein